MGIMGILKSNSDNKDAELNFYDVKGRQKFNSSKYSIVVKSGRRFAVAKAPSGIDAYRILGKA
jgi:hypothetical protein|tara:strand:- start:533 stop:721 length:189 start_codon:yes stop_codon:yes gene_type:complete